MAPAYWVVAFLRVAAALICILVFLPVQAQSQDTEMARKKCIEFGFKDKTASHENCVKQFLQSTGAAKAPSKPAAVAAPVSSAMQREEKFWDGAIATGNREAFEAYLASYPNGVFAGLARANLARFNSATLAQQAAAEAAQKLAATTLAAGKPGPGQVFKDCSDCPEMVLIPAGSFTMGSNEYADEMPTHTVSVRSFLIGKTEVTQGQWRAVMGNNPSSFGRCGDDCPVEQVSWNDAQEFARRLSQKTGKQYRLPSEAEWEYAARAGSNTKWSFGGFEYQLADYAWYDANSQSKTQRVAQKKPNAFGLYDMHGNVWEWVEDCLHLNYAGAPSDGRAWTAACTNTRGHYLIYRGGSWYSNSVYLRTAYRNSYPPIYHSDNLGFRIAMNL
jgi:formylglycine-generating enzyme required for sulfatase activity